MRKFECKTYMNVHRSILSLILSVMLCVLSGHHAVAQSDTLSGFLQSQEAAARAWLDDLYSHGVEIKGDSVYFNDETRRIASDSVYRSLIYPDAYAWETVAALMQRKWLKPAIWYFINLYHTDTTRRDLVLNMILPLDQTLEMDRAILAAFYTYIAFDPEVYRVENGKTVEVRRPDIAEHKLLAAKAIVDHIKAQRSLTPPASSRQK